MIILGILTEKIVLRPLVNQPPITLFMATIGLAFFVEGLAQLFWGTEVYPINIGIEDQPIEFILQKYDMVISTFDLFAALVSGILVLVLAVFFHITKVDFYLFTTSDCLKGCKCCCNNIIIFTCQSCSYSDHILLSYT